MKFQQIIFALNRIIQVLISLEFTLLNIIPKSLVTLQFLKFLIVQIKAYIQGFEMSYQSFLGHWYPNSYSWFSDSMDILFVPITTVTLDSTGSGFWIVDVHVCFASSIHLYYSWMGDTNHPSSQQHNRLKEQKTLYFLPTLHTSETYLIIKQPLENDLWRLEFH